ncbi:protein CFAP276 [Athalia rosae]|uniref:protein CFAP276 n=1 Tax=Athalia rosae TaxID=37344 RepID=UPI002033D42A|nr:protein CFAP276 [Athalia rosae]XP_048512940.1 protein CFAP276 [Athalia rosae]
MLETRANYESALVRNPYPVPDLGREGIWIARGPVVGSKVVPDDPKWYKRLKPHERLFAHHTLNSIRKDHRLVRTKVPNDALDLALTSSYSHNLDMMVPKAYVHMQPETLDKETWRVLRNQIKVFTKLPPRMGENLYFDGSKTTMEKNSGGGIKQRIHPSSLKLTIEGPHTDQTNPGFSRKIDGTLYSI